MYSPQSVLKKYWGYSSFRPQQEPIIEALIKGQDSLVLLPTGGGKSICFQIPALIMEGICVVVSPLIALMNDQVETLKNKGLKAAALTSLEKPNEIARILDNCIYGHYKFLYLSPERLQNREVQDRIKAMNVSLIAVDEAHCISQWGHDFRPAYRSINILRTLCPNSTFVALTATATLNVQRDIMEQLEFKSESVFKTSFFRKNLSYNTIISEDPSYKTLELIKKHNAPTIIYLNSRRQTEQLSGSLNKQGIKSVFYHGGLEDKFRELYTKKWMQDDIQVMVATNAFGMGIDKPNVGLVIHLYLPDSLEQYYQEAGRAGRNQGEAFAYLILSPSTLSMTKQAILADTPDVKFIKTVYKKVNSYLQIPFGEMPEQEKSLNFEAFCRHNELPKRSTYNAFKVLENHGLLNFNTSTIIQRKVKVLISSFGLQQELKKHTSQAIILTSILQLYPNVFEQMVSINLDKVSKKSKLPPKEVHQNLLQLNNQQIIEYSITESDAQITFFVPREDDQVINPISKSISKYREIKIQKINAVIQYFNNNTTCKSCQLLNYFDETDSDNCKICSSCSKFESTKNISKADTQLILEALKTKPLTSRAIAEVCKLDSSTVILALKFLLENNKIRVTSSNKYQLII